MKYIFNNKEYKKGGHNQTGLGALVYDIFKYYLKNNTNKTYKEIQNIFNPLHKEYSGENSNKKVVFNKNDFDEWYEKASSDTKRDERYFTPISYNNEELYFTTQWGNINDKEGNIFNFLDFAKKNLNYEIAENEEKIEKNILRENKNMKTKNIMLYGSPGVGKTHNYKRLITMIENGNDEKTIFDTISKNENTNDFDNSIFEMIKNEKRIEFVTFHQSYSYEDFIEGFRPQDDGKIELEDGIFKKISQDANEQFEEVLNNQISYDEAYNTLRSNYIDNTISDLKTVTGKGILISNFEDKYIQVKSEDGKNWFNIKKNDLEIVVNEILKQNIFKPSDIKLIDVKKDTIALSGYYFPLGNMIVEIIKQSEVKTKEQKNFYIVIDEINRGNISKIFGELITLIEEDKRGKEEYRVKLPYSKKTFLVPSNLYIIATMNSTDKSIATIDIALRRRFTFLKMKPNLDLVQNQEAKKLMEDLNKHISKTINEDYALGHSYFMNIKDDNDLEFVKEYKIKPLLEEYFYGDEENYKKAIAILGIEDEPNKQ